MRILTRNTKDLLDPLEKTMSCRICDNDRLPDDYRQCDVCGKFACESCTNFQGSSATICKRCMEDSPDKVIAWYESELVKAQQIDGGKDRYIESLKLQIAGMEIIDRDLTMQLTAKDELIKNLNLRADYTHRHTFFIIATGAATMCRGWTNEIRQPHYTYQLDHDRRDCGAGGHSDEGM